MNTGAVSHLSRLKHDKLDISEDLEFVETFCGAQALCHGFRAFQWRAIGLDLQQHEIFQNVMSPKGQGFRQSPGTHTADGRICWLPASWSGVQPVCVALPCHNGPRFGNADWICHSRNKHHDIMANRSAMLMLGSPVKCLNSQAVQ